MLGVTIGLAALIIILSVFNGLEDLNREIFKSFDPDLKIRPAEKKSFLLDSTLLRRINNLEGVAYSTQVLQDKALAQNSTAQTIVDVKGVDSTFSKNKGMAGSLVGGTMSLDINGLPAAFISGGVYNSLGLTVNDFFNPISLLYPKNQSPNLLDPSDNISKVSLEVGGVFILEQQYDNYLYIPLNLMEDLTQSYGKRTAIEITLDQGANSKSIQKNIAALLPKGMEVVNRDEQNASLLKAIKIEKLFVFIALIFIVGIASFNIFYALSMLVLDKKDDIKTLSALGASKGLVKRIFITEGFIISGFGVILGLVIGLGVCWVQSQFGIVGLGMASAVVEAYPIRVMLSDVLFSVLGIIVITFMISLVPARKAATMV